MMNTIKSESIKGVKWSAFDRFTNQGLRFIISVILARMLTPDDFGVIGLLTIFLSLSQSFIDSGFSNALIRKQDVQDVDFSTVFYFNIVVGVLCYCMLFVMAPWVASFFHTFILTDLLRVMAISVVVNSLIVVQIAKLTINIDFKTQAKASLTASIVSGIIGIALAFLQFGVWSLVAQSLSQAIINAVMLWILTKWRPLWMFSYASFKELFSFGSKLLLSGLIHQVYLEMTTIVIGKFYTAKDLGYYTRGNQFASLPSLNLIAVLQRVTFPIFSKIQDNDIRLIDVYRKYIKFTSIIIFFFMTILAALAKPMVLFLLTEKWTETVVYLQIFCLALAFDHITMINLNLLQVKGRTDLYLKLEIIKKTISISILLISIPFGVIAICVSKIIYSQIALFINTYYTGKLFNLTYLKQVKDFIPYFFFSAIACSPSYLFTFSAIHPLIQMSLGFSFSFGIYLYVLNRVKDDCFMNYVKPYLFMAMSRIRGRIK